MAAGSTANLKDRAEEDLRFIRDAMGRGAAFTCVPGRGGVAMGAVGAVAAVLASRSGSPRAWLALWVAAGALAFGIGVVAILRKARRFDHRPAGSAARRFALALLPPLVAGAALTAALARAGSYTFLPAVWLLFYGCGVVGAGVSSVPVVPAFGGALVLLGLAALLWPHAGNALLGVGFGAGHVASGLIVARKHGG
ncbi:MAG TPA: hypothetical protein VLJ18_10470 [Thermoanaerobaculia bacterium]|nr:hypothetical protein [Thermoanaerobaculia bacterium]